MTEKTENYASTFTDCNQGKETGTKVLKSEDLKNYAFGDSLIRVTMEDDNPIFLANDVCNALGYRNSRDALSMHCSSVAKRDVDTGYGVKATNFIYEPDLYALIFGSKLDTARSFQRWVFEEVLPSIRKTGAYRKTDINQNEVYNYNELRETMARMEARLMKIERIKPAKIPEPANDPITTITVCVTPLQKKRIELRAKTCYISTSEYTRKIIERYL
ncbi:MAG TPA: BRO family protein [Methanocorpusculum sp.]|nr:BRO family protein [Methanocorpusculum sp.]